MIKHAFIAGLCYLSTTLSPVWADDVTIIHAGSLMIEAGKEIQSQKSIVVRNKHIEKIVDGYKTAADLGLSEANVVDLKNKFVMPGLMDTHVHLTTSLFDLSEELDPLKSTEADLAIMAARNAKKVVEAGFTTVIDLGTGTRDHERAIYAVRDFIHAGKLLGPDIMAVGSPISATGFSRAGGYNDDVENAFGVQGVCDGVESCIQKVREQIKRGADVINVYHTGSMLTPNSVAQTFSNAELKAIADTARMLGKVVIADGGNTPNDASGTNNAIRAGFTVIDTVSLPGEETFNLLKDVDGYFAPHVFAQIDGVGDTLDTLEEGTMGWAPRPLLELLFKFKQLKPSALIAYEAGANLLISSDSGVIAHGKNGQELIEYVALGISPLDTLKAATINVAKAFNIYDRTGSITVGKEADIIAFGENPLKNMKTVLNPVFVMSDGKVMIK